MINISVFDNHDLAQPVYVQSDLYLANIVCTPFNAALYFFGESQNDNEEVESVVEKGLSLNLGQYVEIYFNEKVFSMPNEMLHDDEVKKCLNKLSEIESRYSNVPENVVANNKGDSIEGQPFSGFLITTSEKKKILLEGNDHLQLNLSMSNGNNEVELEIFKERGYLDSASRSTLETTVLCPGKTITVELV